MGTFAVIDNLFPAIVSHQPGKIDGFRASGMTSAAGYLNATLLAAVPGVALLLAVAGAFLAPLGAIVDEEIGATKAHWRRVTGRR